MITDKITFDSFPYEDVERSIGHKFTDRSLALTAFTRSSYANEHEGVSSNENLEFLGDAVLGLIVSKYLFGTNCSVGKLTERKKRLVSNKPLAYLCEKKGYYKYLIMGKGDRKTFSLSNKNVLEDLVEAIIAAIYLDGGYAAAEKFVYDNVLSDEHIETLFIDYVSDLKEYCEKQKIGAPEYRYEDLSDKNGSVFRTEVLLNGTLVAESLNSGGESVSKQEASKKALLKLKSEDK